MKPHTRIYFKHFGYDISSWIECEIPGCGQQAVDIHHINCRGMGGMNKDNIENLMALCRKHHDQYGDKKQHKEYLTEVHLEVLGKIFPFSVTLLYG